MFQAGDAISYGNFGVCRVMDVREETFGPVRRTYYVLDPVYNGSSTIYCPVDQEKIPLRKLPTPQEIEQLIQAMPTVEPVWYDNDTERRDRFADILKSGDRSQRIQLIRSLYLHQQKRQAMGKKLHMADERVMRDAERLLYEEFGHVLGLAPDDVPTYIRDRLSLPEEKTPLDAGA